MSLGAAAALLIGLVVVSSVFRPGGVDSAVSDVGSAIGLDVFRGDSAAPETASTTTSTTTTTVPPTTTAPPQTTTTAPPAPSEAPSGEPVPGAGQDPSWWFSPEAWELFQQYWDDGDGRDWGDDDRDGHSGRGDRDGDREGDGDGSDGETRPGDGTENGDGGGGSSTSTSSPPGSTPTSGASSSPDSGWSEDSTP